MIGGALERLGDAVGKIKVNLLDGMIDKGVVRVRKKNQSIPSTDYVFTTCHPWNMCAGATFGVCQVQRGIKD